MDLTITTLEGKDAGKVKLNEEIFGLDPRDDILQRVVRWQLARRQQGSHKAQGRGGGQAHGPVVRNHDHDLPKKVLALGLRHALSAKAKASDLIIIDDLASADAKTKQLVSQFAKLGLENALLIGGAEIDANFQRAASNIPNIDVLPVQGINVYDILRRGKLVLSKAAVEALEERFK
uniref:Large ribosomal subunit protein uL4 n=1 Tax=Brucella ceti TaxID=120577 RepID=Q06RI4_9HYPH|nr:23S ribosomal protein L4 [Brucella ceti]